MTFTIHKTKVYEIKFSMDLNSFVDVIEHYPRVRHIKTLNLETGPIRSFAALSLIGNDVFQKGWKI